MEAIPCIIAESMDGQGGSLAAGWAATCDGRICTPSEREPLGPGAGFEFNNKIVGGRIPQEYIPSVEKGVIQALQSGPFAGYPVVDMETPGSDLRYS